MLFENLRVYQAAQELRKDVDKLMPTLQPVFQSLFDHVSDAVDSISNNIAEGADSIYVGKQRSYFEIAAGSAREARAGLRSIDRRGGFGKAKAFRAIVLTLSISKMLKALIDQLPEE